MSLGKSEQTSVRSIGSEVKPKVGCQQSEYLRSLRGSGEVEIRP